MSARVARNSFRLIAAGLVLALSTASWIAGSDRGKIPRISAAAQERITGANQALRYLDGNLVCSGSNLEGAQQPAYCTGPLGSTCVVCEIGEIPTLKSAIAPGPLDPTMNVQDTGISKDCDVFRKFLGRCERDENNQYYCQK